MNIIIIKIQIIIKVNCKKNIYIIIGNDDEEENNNKQEIKLEEIKEKKINLKNMI